MADKAKKNRDRSEAENRQNTQESDSKNRVDMLNRSQIDEVPKNPPRIDNPEYQPPIRL